MLLYSLVKIKLSYRVWSRTSAVTDRRGTINTSIGVHCGWVNMQRILGVLWWLQISPSSLYSSFS